jgi:hypothetical protein
MALASAVLSMTLGMFPQKAPSRMMTTFAFVMVNSGAQSGISSRSMGDTPEKYR